MLTLSIFDYLFYNETVFFKNLDICRAKLENPWTATKRHAKWKNGLHPKDGVNLQSFAQEVRLLRFARSNVV